MDEINGRQVECEKTKIFQLDTDEPLSADKLMKKFPKVFGPHTGQMPREYNIRLNPDVQPVQDAPRRVPVVLSRVNLSSWRSKTSLHL